MLCLKRKEQRLRENDNALATLRDSKDRLAEVMRERRTLANIDGCSWHAFAHPCNALALVMTSSHAQSREGADDPILETAKSWTMRHVGVKTGEKKRMRATVSVCLREGRCHCRRQHKTLRDIRDNILSILRNEYNNKVTRKTLADGWCVLAIYSRSSETSWDLLFAHIALQYFSPFRPTVALLQHHPDSFAMSSAEVIGSLRGESQVTAFTLKLQLENRKGYSDLPALRTLVELCAGLSPERTWWCRVLRLSDRQAPGLLLPGCVRVLLEQSGEQELWNPANMPDEPDDVLGILLGQHVLDQHPENINEEGIEEAIDELEVEAEDHFDANVRAELPGQEEQLDGGEFQDPVLTMLEVLQEASMLEDQASSTSSSSSDDDSSSTSSTSSASSSRRPADGPQNGDRLVERDAGNEGREGADVPRDAEVAIMARLRRDSIPVIALDGEPSDQLLRYKPQSQDLYINCSHHRNCTRTRTLKQGRRVQQGKPIGELCAWALAAEQFDTKASHQAFCPDHGARVAGRNQLKLHGDEYRLWAALERETRAGEASEPE